MAFQLTLPVVLMPLIMHRKEIVQASNSDRARSHITGPTTSIPELSLSTRRLHQHTQYNTQTRMYTRHGPNSLTAQY